MTTPYTVLFCGTPECAVPSLQALIKSDEFTVQAVVTQPDRPAGRKKILTAPPIKLAAQAANLPVIQPEKLRLNDIEGLTFDYLVVVAFGQIISRSILALPRIAAINVHPSLLPRWRGATPIPATIAAGDKLGGVTIQKMQYELDAGDILNTYQTDIKNSTTSGQLFEELFTKGAELLLETLKAPLRPIAQDESQITHCGKLSRADGELDPLQHTAEYIERVHRAYYPWPGVTLLLPSGPLKIHKASLSHSTDATIITCKDGSILYAAEVQAAGKQKVTGAEWQKTQKKEA